MTYLFPLEVSLSMDDSLDPSGPRYHFYSVSETAASVQNLVDRYYSISNDSTTVFQYVMTGDTPIPVQLKVGCVSFFGNFYRVIFLAHSDDQLCRHRRKSVLHSRPVHLRQIQHDLFLEFRKSGPLQQINSPGRNPACTFHHHRDGHDRGVG